MKTNILLTTTESQPDALYATVIDGDKTIAAHEQPHSQDTTSEAAGCAKAEMVTINDPQTLTTLGKQMASSDRITCKPASIDSSTPANEQAEYTLDPTSIKELRLGILATVTSEVELTPTELNGGIDGPFMSALIKSWREAFRSIPPTHSIEKVQFDMHCPGDRHEPRHIIRLLQEVSTVMSMKAKRNLGREVAFEAVGCVDEEKRKWLQASLPKGGKK